MSPLAYNLILDPVCKSEESLSYFSEFRGNGLAVFLFGSKLTALVASHPSILIDCLNSALSVPLAQISCVPDRISYVFKGYDTLVYPVDEPEML